LLWFGTGAMEATLGCLAAAAVIVALARLIGWAINEANRRSERGD